MDSYLDTDDLNIECHKQNSDRSRMVLSSCQVYNDNDVSANGHFGLYLEIKLNVWAEMCPNLLYRTFYGTMSKAFSNMSKCIFLLNSKLRFGSDNLFFIIRATLRIDWNWHVKLSSKHTYWNECTRSLRCACHTYNLMHFWNT